MILKDKVAIITGCNRGIGKAILEVFAQNGATVFACSRKESNDFSQFIEQLKKQYNTEIFPIYFDVEKIEEIKQGIKLIREKKLNIDILVNNAGITSNELFLMTSLESIQKQFDINFKSVFIISQYISKMMIKNQKGSIINISSISALGGDCGRALYGATKAAVSSLTKTMATELGTNGIRVNAVAPGFINTDMQNLLSAEALNTNLNLSKLKRIGEPKEVANAVMFLASDLASYITGQVIRVDGGVK